jgi:shikimate kinase
MKENTMVVITGPLAGGKSTTAVALGKCLRRNGKRTAVVDLDDMYLMSKQKDDGKWNEPEVWSAARRGCGALAESFYSSSYDIVVVEGGDFKTSEELRELRSCLQLDVDVKHFTLVVSWEVSFWRAQGDPHRHIADTAGYKKLHDHFISRLPFLRGVSDCIDADDLNPDQVVAYIAQKVLGSDESAQA